MVEQYLLILRSKNCVETNITSKIMTRILNSAVKHTAQAYLCAEAENGTPSGVCGSACGAGDEKPEPKPAACGSACGAGEK